MPEPVHAPTDFLASRPAGGCKIACDTKPAQHQLIAKVEHMVEANPQRIDLERLVRARRRRGQDVIALGEDSFPLQRRVDGSDLGWVPPGTGHILPPRIAISQHETEDVANPLYRFEVLELAENGLGDHHPLRECPVAQ